MICHHVIEVLEEVLKFALLLGTDLISHLKGLLRYFLDRSVKELVKIVAYIIRDSPLVTLC